MKAFKINTTNPPSFVIVQDFTVGVLGYWIMIGPDCIKISNGDFVITDNKLTPIQYIPASQAGTPDIFQDYKDVVGKDLLVTIWKALNNTGLTDAVKASILQTIANVQIACLAGEIRVARDIANATATTANFTAARKTALLAIIDTAITEKL